MSAFMSRLPAVLTRLALACSVASLGLVGACSLEPHGSASEDPSSSSSDAISVTLSEITAIVDDVMASPPKLTPTQKLAYLPLFYDVLRTDPKDLVDSNIYWVAKRGARTLWEDTGVADGAIEAAFRGYIGASPAPLNDRLRWHFGEEMRWGDGYEPWFFGGDLPVRYAPIVLKSVQEVALVSPLLAAGAHLEAKNPLVKDKALNASFNAAVHILEDAAIAELPAGRVDLSLRQKLFDSTESTVKQVPYLAARYGNKFESRMSDLVALHLMRIIDLNPHTNRQGISPPLRDELRGRIRALYGLAGLDATIWDEHTILVNPRYKKSLPFYSNLFGAYGDTYTLIPGSLVVYDNFWSGKASKAFPCCGWGQVEVGIHGVGHMVEGYLEQNNASNSRLGTERFAALKDRAHPKCSNHLPATVMGFGCDSDWWWSWPELLATLVNVYMVDTNQTFQVARGSHDRLDQFLFMADVFSLGADTVPFFHFPISDWFSTPNKPVEKVAAPIGRDGQGRITSLEWKGTKYLFTLDADGYVTGIITTK